jgi:hypothetical protein
VELGRSRGFHRKTNTCGGVGHLLVVGNDRPQLAANDLGRRDMDRSEASQLESRCQRRSPIEKIGAEQDLVEA